MNSILTTVCSNSFVGRLKLKIRNFKYQQKNNNSNQFIDIVKIIVSFVLNFS